jgi:hypothetical protein
LCTLLPVDKSGLPGRDLMQTGFPWTSRFLSESAGIKHLTAFALQCHSYFQYTAPALVYLSKIASASYSALNPAAARASRAFYFQMFTLDSRKSAQLARHGVPKLL